MVLSNLLIYLLSFVGVWVGAGLAISSVERLSKNLKLSSFALSFIILGFFTSLSEFSVGVNALTVNDPEIYVGNLIGATIVIFMMIVPLLAITGSKIKITKEFGGVSLVLSLVTIAMPVLLSIDGEVSQSDGIVAMALFVILVIIIQTKRGLFNANDGLKKLSSIKTGREFLKILLGVVIIFIASRFVVDQTIFFSELLHVSPFLISLLIIGIGTNIPELTLVVRSMFMKSNQVAFGDYVGSAAFNTFIFGLLTFLHGKPVYLSNSYLVSLLFLIVGLIVFYYFSRTNNSVSRLEGFLLLMLYLLFVFVEILIH